MRSSSIRALILIASLLVAAPLLAASDDPNAMRDSFAIAMHGTPALPRDFDHFPYADPRATKGGQLNLGMLGSFDSLNPFNLQAGSAAQGLMDNVFQTLMARSWDEPFTLYGSIAKSIETNDERSRVIFHLDSRAKFSDGHPLTSADVLFSFNLLKTRGRPQQRAAFSRIKSAVAPDPETVIFDLTGLDDREMPLILGLMPILPEHATDLERFDGPSLKIPIGSGPYIISSVQPGESLTLERNSSYWAADLPFSKGLYNFERIKIDYYRDASSLYEAFKSGAVDFREETSPTRWQSGYDFPAMNDGRDRRETVPLGGPKGFQGFVFNMRRPFFADRRVREAMGDMFDFQWIDAKLFGGLYVRAKSFFDDSELSAAGRPADARERALLAPFPGAVEPSVMSGTWKPPESDGSGRDRGLARHALSLLESAGWIVHNGALVRKDNHQPFHFEIMVGDSQEERIALVFAQSLARIGVVADVRLVDEVQYQRRRQKFDFDMTVGTWLASASPGNEQWSRWGSASADQEASLNLAGVRSPAVDAMIAALLAARSQEDFEASVRALDRVLLSGSYAVPLYYSPNDWIAYSSRLEHPRPSRYERPPFGATLDAFWRKPT